MSDEKIYNYIDLATGKEKTLTEEDKALEEGYNKEEWGRLKNWNGYNYTDITVQNITNLYLFGQITQPVNLDDRVRSAQDYEKNWTVRVDMQSYIDYAGKYGIPGNTAFVKNFMGSSTRSIDQNVFSMQMEDGTLLKIPGISEGQEYTVLDIVNKILTFDDTQLKAMGITFKADDDRAAIVRNKLFRMGFVHAGVDPDASGAKSRTFIFGTDSLVMSWDSIIKFDLQNPLLKDVKMMPGDDNFDFVSEGLTQKYNDWALEDIFDRFNIGKKVRIEYQGRENVKGIETYTRSDFEKQQNWFKEVSLNDASEIFNGISAGIWAKDQMGNAIDVTSDGKQLIYGNYGNETINERYIIDHRNELTNFTDLSSALQALVGNRFNLSLEKFMDRSIIAGDGDDTVDMTWTTGQNDIHGGRGNDTLKGGAGKDKIYGDYRGEKYDMYNEGTATIEGVASENNGTDKLYGGQGDDELYGGAGNDELYGELDNDILYGELGSDVLHGGNGNDTLYADGRDVSLGQGKADLSLSATDKDRLYGGQGDDKLFGGHGDDLLEGGKDNDRLEGGLGFDTYNFSIGDGKDTVLDIDGKGQISINGKIVSIFAKDRFGRFSFVKNNIEIIATLTNSREGIADLVLEYGALGAAKKDRITIKDWKEGDLGISLGAKPPPQEIETNNEIIGDKAPLDIDLSQSGVQTSTDKWGNILTSNISEPGRWDTLYDTDKNDLIKGLDGDDTLTSKHGGVDKIYGGTGNDTITVLTEGSQAYGEDDDDTLYLTGNNIYLDGGMGSDRIFANFGNQAVAVNDMKGNILVGGVGSDVLASGNSSDKLYAGNIMEEITEEWINGEITGPKTKGDLMVGNGGDDLFVGSDQNDYIVSGWGNNIVYGGDGDDTVLVYDGYYINQIDKNWDISRSVATENDIVNYIVEFNSGIYGIKRQGEYGNNYIYLGAGNDWGFGGHGTDHIYGGLGVDVIFGLEGNDYLEGNDGNDHLFGDGLNDNNGWGSDELYGGDGDDILKGGGGTDFLYGGKDNDKLYGEGNGDTLNAARDYLYGEDGDDELYGNGGDDILFGGQDNDILVGDDVTFNEDGSKTFITEHDGNDYLDGGDGIDILIGGGGNDDLFGGTGNDHLFGGSPDETSEIADGDDHLYGGAGNDYLYGGTGNDHLYGEGDNDHLVSNFGNDYLDGGSGNDYYQVSLYNQNTVHIKDQDNNNWLHIQANISDARFLKTASGYEIQTDDGTIVIDNLEHLSLLRFDDYILTGEDIQKALLALNAPETKGSLTAAEIVNEGQTWDWALPEDAFSGATTSIRSMAGVYKEFWQNKDERFFQHFSEEFSIGRLSKDQDGRYYDTVHFADGSMLDRYYDASLTNVVGLSARADSDKKLSLTYSATLADGSVLPDWLSIDPLTGKITSAVTNEIGSYTVLITATNFFGKTATQELTINLLKPETEHFGTEQDDQIKTGFFDDTIYAGEGNDIIYSDYDPSRDELFNQSIYQYGPYGNDIVYGGAGNDIIYGGYGNNYLDGGEGDDQIIGTGTLIGGTGNDTLTGSGILVGGTGNDQIIVQSEYGVTSVHFNLGDGQDTISCQNYKEDNKIVFGTGITTEMIRFETDQNDLILYIDGTSDQIRLIDYATNNNAQGIIKIEFADGSIWEDFRNRIPKDIIYGTDGDDYLGEMGKNHIDAKAGDDHIYMDYGTVIGGKGNDNIFLQGEEIRNEAWSWYPRQNNSTIIFNVGDGQDVIETNTGVGKNTIRFGEGITKESISFIATEEYGYYSNLIIRIGDSDDQITLKGYLWQGGMGGLWYKLEFADGSVIEDIRPLINISIDGTDEGDYIQGTALNDIIYAGAGNDSISDYYGLSYIDAGDGDDRIDIGYGTVIGGKGDDQITINGNREYTFVEDSENVEFKATTIYFNVGDGKDTISDFTDHNPDKAGNRVVPKGSHNIVFGAGITKEMISFEERPNLWGLGRDLIIKIGSSEEDQITLLSYYYFNDSTSPFSLYQLSFADGKQISLQNLFNSTIDSTTPVNQAATLSQVNNLISAMAAFAPEAGCSSTLPTNQYDPNSVMLTSNAA